MNHQVTAEIKTATPELVEFLLRMNTDNRATRPGVVDLYKKEINEGRWVLTNQGIGVSSDGLLIDGQHRLLALRDCGYPPVQLLIIYGLSREARLAVDQHAKRSARDLLQFAFNARVARCAPSVARIIFKVRCGWRTGAVSIGSLMEVIEEHMEEIESVLSCPGFETFFSAPLLSAAVLSLKTAKTTALNGGADPMEVIYFMERVRLGENLSSMEPAYHLRNLVMKGQVGGGAMQKEFFLKAMRSIQYHFEGKKIMKLYA